MKESGAKTELMGIRDRLAAYNGAITAAELATLLAVQPDTLYKLARKGDIPHMRIGSSVRFDPKAIAEWIASTEIGGDWK